MKNKIIHINFTQVTDGRSTVKRKLLVLFCLLTITGLMTTAQEPDKRKRAASNAPNVVFILADDVGIGDIGIYGGKFPTPNIDKLAQQGMRFTDAHSPAALCAPSRFSLLTGSYPYRNGRPEGSWDINYSSGFSHNGNRTKAGRHITVAEIMQKAGYKTAFFGKMHTGGTVYNEKGEVIRDKAKINTVDLSRGVDDALNEHGFDYWFGLLSGIQHEPYAYFENGRYHPVDIRKPANNSNTVLLKNGFYRVGDNGLSEIVEAAQIPARTDADYNSSQAGIIFTNGALNFIDRHLAENRKMDKDQPFLLYFASQAIHVPHTAPFDFDGDPTNIDVPVAGKTGAITSDVLYELDLQVGKILAKLEDAGIADNTLIFFTSDNGALWPQVTKYGNPAHDNNGPFRDYKASVYEGGHRVPFIVKWGNGTEAGSIVPPGTVSSQTISGLDWVATMYELTGQNMQEDQAKDCASLLPILTGKQPETEKLHDFILYQGGAYVGAIREGNLVLLVNRNKEATEFYDLTDDIGQKNNLILKNEYKPDIERLRKKFLTYNDYDNKTDEPRTTKPFRVKK